MNTEALVQLDHAHVWHPFTPMQQWRATRPLIIDRAEGFELIDTEGRRYIDGVSSIWCNVHGHRVEAIDRAIRAQLDKVAFSTLLGLGSTPSIELAARLCAIAPPGLDKVFYSDSGATSVEVAFKMAVGYQHHRGRPEKNRFIGLRGAYHGDTTGAMSVGYCELFHRPFLSMVFPTRFVDAPDALRAGEGAPPASEGRWPSEDPDRAAWLREQCLGSLDRLLDRHADETAAIVIEPVMQGAAGMICQPEGFVRGAAELARRHDVLLIADEVATGFGRTGTMFACDREGVTPDIMCLAKGLTGGYLPLAATLARNEIEAAFCGPVDAARTLYHGHTYTGSALACAAALASLDLFESAGLIEHVGRSARLIAERLEALRGCPRVADVRQRGMMTGIELVPGAGPTAADLCLAVRRKGLILRPLGDVVVLMPAPAMPGETLARMLEIVVGAIAA
ncbi:MAG: adenosylmethionine--8-amino-7-oxononanoate transaminase [Phycisphaeraceae bacterium]|nr:adenosylmethionine--8-amino-7-oxononanoate transaminase [Phycisphaeraceae bacterium]